MLDVAAVANPAVAVWGLEHFAFSIICENRVRPYPAGLHVIQHNEVFVCSRDTELILYFLESFPW